MNKELDSFFRRIKLRAHFGNDTGKQTAITEEDTSKPRSAWELNHTHHTVDTFCDAVKSETKQNRKAVQLQNNLSKDELNALNELQNRDGMIITKADKGGAVVIMDVKDYIDEATRQFDNENCYKKLSNDPTKLHAERTNICSDQFKDEGIITEKVAKGLKVFNPKIPKFSTLPKLHKEGIPGRPVLDSMNCHSMKISKYGDYHLQPEVVKLKS